MRALAASYSETIGRHRAMPEIASGAAHRRELLTHRLALPVADAETMAQVLARHARGERPPEIETAKTTARSAPVAFVYSGNGAQWAGMGRAAFTRNAQFRGHFEAIDAEFRSHADWSLYEMLMAGELAEKIRLTSVAQPLLFAIQSAMTATLRDLGLQPRAVLGHSVGEIAAAEAAGALTRAAAVLVIYRRSQIQERVRGLGQMMALKLSASEARTFIADHDLDGLEIAAINSPSSVTLAGPAPAIAAAQRVAASKGISSLVLALDYPFHSRLLDPLEPAFVASMTGLSTQPGSVAFLSTVSGSRRWPKLGARYWWRNIREPVRFAEAVQAAANLGCRVFLEIGPHPVLLNNIAETLSAVPDASPIGSFDNKERSDGPDPLLATLARAAVQGAEIDRECVFGARVQQRVELPPYPFQRTRFRTPVSPEAIDIWGTESRHPLIGARLTGAATEWRTVLDPVIVPYLADHKVDGEIVMPAAGFAEMALAAARDWLGDGPVLLEDFDIIQGLVFAQNTMREVLVRLSSDTQVVEILSRPRRQSGWTLHARGRIGRPAQAADAPEGLAGDNIIESGADEIYQRASRLALDYGPAFRRAVRVRRDQQVMEIEIAPDPGGIGRFSVAQVLPPPVLDAAFHGLVLIPDLAEQRTWLPIRIGSLRVHIPGAPVVRAICRFHSRSARSFAMDLALLGADGAVVAALEDVRFQAVLLGRRAGQVFFHAAPVRVSTANTFDVRAAIEAAASGRPITRPREDWLLLTAFARSLSHRVLAELAGTAPFSLARLVERGILATPAVPLAAALLNILAEAGLASEARSEWTLKAKPGLPPPDLILRTLCADHPERSAELAMAARVLADLGQVLRTGRPIAYPTHLVEQFETEALPIAFGIEAARAILDTLMANVGDGVLRIVVAESTGLASLRLVMPKLRQGHVVVTVAGTDRKRLAGLEARIGRWPGLDFVDIGADGHALDALPPFDLALAVGFGPMLGDERKLGPALARALRQHRALLAIVPMPHAVADILLGVTEGWFAPSAAPEFPVSRLTDQEGARAILVESGFEEVGDSARCNVRVAACVREATPDRTRRCTRCARASGFFVIGRRCAAHAAIGRIAGKIRPARGAAAFCDEAPGRARSGIGAERYR